ncbi:MAG: MFS transporter [Desulfobulbaceae bacterium]|nr:MFS transporter [Desulfobulbaceae bacterium]
MPQAKNKWLTFLIVAMGVFMSTLDSSMVNIALPTIMKDFHSSLKNTEWVVMIYLLTITASLLFWGHLSDRLGRSKIYTSGMLTFGLGSLACAYSPSLLILIFSRLVQALGAAMMMATGPAIIKETFPKEQLGRGLGLIGVAVSLGLMSGPSLGGVLLEFYSWHALFLITVPIGLVFAVLAFNHLPGPVKHFSSPLDWLGALSWAAALILFSMAITHATAVDWSAAKLVTAFILGGLALACFIKIETMVPHPLLHLELFKKRYFSMAILSATLSFAVLFAVIMLTPFYLDRILQLPPSQIGLVMLAIPSSILVVGPVAGWLSDYVGARLLTTLGLAVATCGVFLLTRLEPTSTPLDIAARLVMLGFGQAMFLSPNSASILAKAGKTQAGAASALLATARNLGMLLGIAQAALLFSLYFGSLTNGLDMKDFTGNHTDAFMVALKNAFCGAGITGIIGVIASLLRGNSTRDKQDAAEQTPDR